MPNSIWIDPSGGGSSSGGSSTFQTITVTGQSQFADGTATLPGIAFASEPALGFYRPGASQIYLSTAKIFGVAKGTTGGISLASGQITFGSVGILAWSAAAEQDVSDVNLRRDAAGILALRTGTAAQTFRLGQGNTALAAGRLSLGRDAAAGVAPGAGFGLLRFEAGTNANTLKLVAYSGTSTTGVTVTDNIGAGN